MFQFSSQKENLDEIRFKTDQIRLSLSSRRETRSTEDFEKRRVLIETLILSLSLLWSKTTSKLDVTDKKRKKKPAFRIQTTEVFLFQKSETLKSRFVFSKEKQTFSFSFLSYFDCEQEFSLPLKRNSNFYRSHRSKQNKNKTSRKNFIRISDFLEKLFVFSFCSFLFEFCWFEKSPNQFVLNGRRRPWKNNVIHWISIDVIFSINEKSDGGKKFSIFLLFSSSLFSSCSRFFHDDLHVINIDFVL